MEFARASPTQWTWVWVNCGSSWWTGRPGMLHSHGLDTTERLNWIELNKGFPGGASGEESACQFRRHKRHELVPWSGRHGGRGLGNPFPCSFLGNLLDRRVWQTAVCGVTKSCTGLSTAQHGVYRIQSWYIKINCMVNKLTVLAKNKWTFKSILLFTKASENKKYLCLNLTKCTRTKDVRNHTILLDSFFFWSPTMAYVSGLFS